jgi:hypothetical protein
MTRLEHDLERDVIRIAVDGTAGSSGSICNPRAQPTRRIPAWPS